MTELSRIKPPMGDDNAWWWQQAALGKLVIQRCQQCQTLRHPPHPMCNQCRSMEWDFIEACGRGHLHTYTVLHNPRFPGYQYPITIAVVDLEEGERIVSQLVDCERDAVTIGMPLQMHMQEDADGFKLPVFRPVV